MDAKITLTDIAQALAHRGNIPSTEAMTFVRQFFDTIRESLLLDKIVKVKGFGTFKLISVEARESVSVADGSRIQIAGHTKVTFTPDVVLRDAVNKPFAEFETILLDDKLNLSDFDALDRIEEPVALETMPASVGQEDVITEEEPSVEEQTPVDEPPLEPEEEQAEEPVQQEEEEVPAEEEVAMEQEEKQVEEVSEEQTGEQPEVNALSEETIVPEETALSEETIPESIVLPEETIEQNPSLQEDEQPSKEQLTESSEQEDNDSKEKAPIAVVCPLKPRYHTLWQSITICFLGLLLFLAGYCVGYLQPFRIPYLQGVPSRQPEIIEVIEDSVDDITKQVLPSKESENVLSSNDASLDEEDLEEESNYSIEDLPKDAVPYPQVEDGDFWIVGVKDTEIMTPGSTLLRFSAKHYDSDQFLDYICVMNDIIDPDIVPLNKPIKIPKLRHK